MGALFGSMSAVFIGLSDLFNRKVAGAATVASVALSLQFFAAVTALAATQVLDSEFIWRDLSLGFLGGLGMAVGLGAYYGGVTRSTATVVAPTVGTLASVIPFMYTIVTGARPSVLAWTGAIIALLGLLLITMTGSEVARVRTGLMWGIAAGCGYGFALSAVIAASSESGSWPAVGQRSMAFVLTLAFAARTKAPFVPPRPVRGAAIAGGVMSGAASVAFLAGAQFNATAAVVTSSMFPAIAVLIGWWYYDDSVSGRQLAGMVAVLAGVAAVAAG